LHFKLEGTCKSAYLRQVIVQIMGSCDPGHVPLTKNI